MQSFCDKLILISIMFSSFIHAVTYCRTAFFFKGCIPLQVFTKFSLSIHLLMDIYLGCFHILALTHGALINMEVLISIWDHNFGSFGKHPEVRLLDHMIVLFLIFWLTFWTVFHSGFISLHCHQQYANFFHICCVFVSLF